MYTEKKLIMSVSYQFVTPYSRPWVCISPIFVCLNFQNQNVFYKTCQNVVTLVLSWKLINNFWTWLHEGDASCEHVPLNAYVGVVYFINYYIRLNPLQPVPCNISIGKLSIHKRSNKTPPLYDTDGSLDKMEVLDLCSHGIWDQDPWDQITGLFSKIQNMSGNKLSIFGWLLLFIFFLLGIFIINDVSNVICGHQRFVPLTLLQDAYNLELMQITEDLVKIKQIVFG